tara:strand:+ start:734 stop:859 length:126 start_codon:yes stop_codon:yes gene_type:complete
MLELIFIFGVSVGAIGYLFVALKKKTQPTGCCGQNCNCHEN